MLYLNIQPNRENLSAFGMKQLFSQNAKVTYFLNPVENS